MNRSFIYGMLAAISICAAPSIFALTFSTNVEGKNSKFSQCAWESDPHINKVPLRGKPGRRDNVYIRTYGKDFEIDMPVEVKSIAFLYDTNTKMENKKLVTTRGDMGFESSGGAGTNNVLKAKKSEFIINGSLRFYLWEKCQGMGSSALQMEDSKMMLNGNILYSVPALYLKATKNRSGAEISLTGALSSSQKARFCSIPFWRKIRICTSVLFLTKKTEKSPSSRWKAQTLKERKSI